MSSLSNAQSSSGTSRSPTGIVTVLFISIAVLYVLGVYYEFYLKTPLVDFTQHLLFGVALGVLWLKFSPRRNYSAGLMAVVGFVLSISLAWEFFELLLWNGLPEYSSIFMLHSPTVGDALTDMLAALLGGVASARYFKI